MNARRRAFLTAFVPGAVLAGATFTKSAGVGLCGGQSRVPNNPPPHQNPVPPTQPVIPAPSGPPTKAQLRQNGRDLRKDVDQLFSLAQELKNLAAKNDSVDELSVALISKTEEIEKLAKKIRDLARS